MSAGSLPSSNFSMRKWKNRIYEAIPHHQGTDIYDAPLFEEILGELKWRQFARTGDPGICDRGYYSYRKYVDGLFEFGMVLSSPQRKNSA